MLRIGRIDTLRAVGALVVVVAHLKRPDSLLLFPYWFGNLGVSLFIVLSGFCIHLSNARSLHRDGSFAVRWGAFWRRRFFRLYPTYVAAIAFGLLIYFGLARLSQPPEPIAYLSADLATHFLMIHNLFWPYSHGLANPPLWSLGLEEQLYLLYMAVAFFRRRGSIESVIAITGTVSVVWWLAYYFFAGHLVWPDQAIGTPPWQLGQWSGWPFGYWFGWCLGAVAAEWHVRGRTTWFEGYGKATMFLLLAMFTSERCLKRFLDSHWLESKVGPVAGGWVTLCSLSEIFAAVAFFVLVNTAIRRGAANQSPPGWEAALEKLGIMSYSLYLTHNPTLQALEAVTAFPNTVPYFLLRQLLFVPACIAVAWLFFKCAERPFLRRPPAVPAEAR